MRALRVPAATRWSFGCECKATGLDRVSFETEGCGPSLAAGSMATELAKGRTVEKALHINQQTILDIMHT